MKKFILLGIVAFLSSGLFANPNPDPELHIGEFMFTGQGHWSLEISFYYCNVGSFSSITLQSNSGTATVTNFQFNQSICYFTDLDLSQTLTINPNGDRLILTGNGAFFWPLNCTLAFGSVENPDVLAPLTGQSIERFTHTNCYYPYDPMLDVFTLCKYPTMGLPNDTTGCMGTMQGIMYDMHGGVIGSSTLITMDYGFSSSAQGGFSSRIFSRIYSWDTLCYHEANLQYLPGPITPISYTMVPDSVINRDIHFLEPFLVGIKPQPKATSSALNIFPNPVRDAVTVSYTSELTADPVNLTLEIYDMKGQKMIRKDLESYIGVVTIPIDLISGIYIANLKRDGKITGSERFVVNKTE
jgi:hypothetical protein